MPVASGEAQLTVAAEPGGSMRLDFDFKGGGGLVVARRVLHMDVPDSYAFRFRVRGSAPANKFEFKLADPSGKNVWRWQQEAFEFPAEWHDLLLRSRDIEFAWGPAGGGSPRALGAIEFVI